MTGTSTAFARRIPSGRAGLWNTRRPLLGRLDIELTERCNNDCLHCSINLPAGDDVARRRESTAGDVKAILKEAASLGCLSVRFTGGEPLLREDFEDIYLAARRLGLKVRVFTNATLMTPRLAALFKKTPPLERIEISVYGMTASSEAAVTQNPCSHQASRRGIALLVENGVPFILKGAVLPSTKNELDRFEAWAGKVARAGEPPAYAMLFDLRSRRDNEAKNRRIRELRLEPAEYVRLAGRRGESHAAELRAFVARFAGAYGDCLFPCLLDAGSVDAYGRFQACLVLRHPDTTYDLRKGSLRQAIVEFLPKVRNILATDPAYLERCGRCFLKPLCLQCPAKSWAEHGTLDTPVDYFCGITHAQAVSLGLLKEGEAAWTVDDWPARVGRPASPSTKHAGTRAEAPAACTGE
jgi:radical SAM protein with 4Fe4S-binding SPASM domain